jgi:hypothetical protein
MGSQPVKPPRLTAKGKGHWLTVKRGFSTLKSEGVMVGHNGRLSSTWLTVIETALHTTSCFTFRPRRWKELDHWPEGYSRLMVSYLGLA